MTQQIFFGICLWCISPMFFSAAARSKKQGYATFFDMGWISTFLVGAWLIGSYWR